MNSLQVLLTLIGAGTCIYWAIRRGFWIADKLRRPTKQKLDVTFSTREDGVEMITITPSITNAIAFATAIAYRDGKYHANGEAWARAGAITEVPPTLANVLKVFEDQKSWASKHCTKQSGILCMAKPSTGFMSSSIQIAAHHTRMKNYESLQTLQTFQVKTVRCSHESPIVFYAWRNFPSFMGRDCWRCWKRSCSLWGSDMSIATRIAFIAHRLYWLGKWNNPLSGPVLNTYEGFRYWREEVRPSLWKADTTASVGNPSSEGPSDV